jgi:hypothetical protein
LDGLSGAIDDWNFNETVQVQDWNQEKGWLALTVSATAQPGEPPGPSTIRSVVVRIADRKEIAAKPFPMSHSLQGRFLTGGRVFCSLPWSGQHTRTESADCWDITTSKTVARPRLQDVAFYGDIQAGGQKLVSDDTLWIPFPIEGGHVAIARRRAIWDVSVNGRIERWKIAKQKNVPPRLPVGPSYRLDAFVERSSISPDGLHFVVAVDGKVTIFDF